MNINDNNLGNRLRGTPQADVINGNGGNDSISGLGGADQLNGGADNDVIDFAFDYLVDTINGGTGSDRLVAPLRLTAPVLMTGNLLVGANIFSGGRQIAAVSQIEAITITGSNANDSLIGGIGNDEITSLAGRDTVSTGAGNDIARTTIDASADSIAMGSGSDLFGATYGGNLNVNFTYARNVGTITLGGQTVATVTETELFQIKTGSGHDTLNGGILTDLLDGGTGANTIFGWTGDDVFTLMLDAWTDDVRGGDGHDRLRVQSNGRDRVVAELVGPGFYDVSLNNVVRIGASGIEAADVFGGSASDIIDGLVGIDNLFGNGGNDVIDAGAGNDNLYGGIGNDTIAGGQGNDLIEGNAGLDRLTGNLGDDRFIFNHAFADGKDYIADFAPTDFIAVRASGFAGLVAGRPVTLIKSADPAPPAGWTTPIFLFDTDTGDLSYDRDGVGATAPIAFATVRTGAGGVYSAFTAADILVI